MPARLIARRQVQLDIMPGLDREELDAVLQRLAKRWSTDDRIAVLVDSLAVKIRRSSV